MARELKIELYGDDDSTNLPGAQIIGLSPTPSTERIYGESIIRFSLPNANPPKPAPVDSISAWYSKGSKLGMEIEGGPTANACSIRECSLDISTDVLYVGIYLHHPVKEVRGWFNR